VGFAGCGTGIGSDARLGSCVAPAPVFHTQSSATTSGGARMEESMLTGWREFENTLETLDRLQRQMDRAFDGATTARRRHRVAWPATNVFETKDAFVIQAEVPGVVEGDVSVSVEDEVLTVRGERKSQVPAGYQVHLRERPPIAFARKLPLPARVDTDAVTAVLEHGVLTVTLPKTREALPRQIAVKAV
jgi:HSP20 family protein